MEIEPLINCFQQVSFSCSKNSPSEVWELLEVEPMECTELIASTEKGLKCEGLSIILSKN